METCIEGVNQIVRAIRDHAQSMGARLTHNEVFGFLFPEGRNARRERSLIAECSDLDQNESRSDVFLYFVAAEIIDTKKGS